MSTLFTILVCPSAIMNDPLWSIGPSFAMIVENGEELISVKIPRLLSNPKPSAASRLASTGSWPNEYTHCPEGWIRMFRGVCEVAVEFQEVRTPFEAPTEKTWMLVSPGV